MLRNILINMLDNLDDITERMFCDAVRKTAKPDRAKAFLTTLVKNSILETDGDRYTQGPLYPDFALKMYAPKLNESIKRRRRELLERALFDAYMAAKTTPARVERVTGIHRQTVTNAVFKGASLKAEDWQALVEHLNIKPPSMLSICSKNDQN